MSNRPNAGAPSPVALPYRADYHMHSKWCDGNGEMRDYVEAGIRLGLTEIGFSVHLPITVPYPKKIYLSRDEVPLYVDAAHRLRDEYAGRISVLLGGECDFAPGQEREIEEAISAWPFDYVIGAIHFIDGWSHDSPESCPQWEKADVARVYRRYYELLGQAVRSGFYDIVAHFDLVKKFGYRPAEDVSDAEAAVTDTVALTRMTVEVNTAGWDKPVGEQYPSERILRMLRERDVSICFGSDAHCPREVARHLDRARAMAASLGWRTAARYRDRKRFEEPLAAQPAAG